MRLFSLLSVVIILFFAACDSEQVVDPQVQEDILGLWELHAQTGAAADICDGQLGELAQFSANGQAYFQCPGADIYYASYTAIDNVLTFTDTGLKYNISLPNDTNMILTAIGLDRVLTYSRNLIYQK